MRKWIIIFIVVIIALGGYLYVYQDHRDIEKENAVFTLTAEAITNEFEINPAEAETKYLNKTISITGIVTEVSTNQITINNKVFCQLAETNNDFKAYETLTIKGRFIGYDTLLEEIKLDQCYIIN